MLQTISLVLVIPAERVAHSVQGFYAVVTVDVNGLGQRYCLGRHQTYQNEVERRNHLRVKIQTSNGSYISI